MSTFKITYEIKDEDPLVIVRQFKSTSEAASYAAKNKPIDKEVDKVTIERIDP